MSGRARFSNTDGLAPSPPESRIENRRETPILTICARCRFEATLRKSETGDWPWPTDAFGVEGEASRSFKSAQRWATRTFPKQFS